MGRFRPSISTMVSSKSLVPNGIVVFQRWYLVVAAKSSWMSFG